MSRSICVCLEFLSEEHKAMIRETAQGLGFAVHFFTAEETEQATDCLQSCEILFAHDPELLRAAPATLKWFCCSWAGVDVFCRQPELFANPGCILTNSNSYGVTIAEHVIMVTLMLLRRMPEYQASMNHRVWPAQHLPIRSIRDARFTILGAGNIGQNVAERLRGMNAGRVTALSRSGRPHPSFDAVYPISALDGVLPETDVLILALPGTAETQNLMNRQRLALLRPDAYLINVGRGTAIDQEALADALNGGRLAGAALDVMVPEPLPEDHPLWSARNLLLTPHISGNMSLGYTQDLTVELFCRDLANYAAGRPLAGTVDRALGY